MGGGVKVSASRARNTEIETSFPRPSHTSVSETGTRAANRYERMRFTTRWRAAAILLGAWLYRASARVDRPSVSTLCLQSLSW